MEVSLNHVAHESCHRPYIIPKLFYMNNKRIFTLANVCALDDGVTVQVWYKYLSVSGSQVHPM